jgi:hypothetical protein
MQDYNSNYYLTSSNLFNTGTAMEAAFNDVAVGGNLESGYILCSNDLTATNNKSYNVYVANNLYVNNILYKNHQNIGFIYIGALNNISLPLSSGSIYDTSTYYTNLNIQTYLINTYTNNYVLLQPYYCLIFYNNDNIVQIIDNTNGTNMLYNMIQFSNNNVYCTKIIIQYKNKNI